MQVPPRPGPFPRNPLYFHDLEAATAIMGFVGMVHKISSRSGTLSRGRLRGSIWRESPCALGLSQFGALGTSAGDRAFDLVPRGRHRESAYLVRFCGRPLLCLHSRSRWAFSRPSNFCVARALKSIAGAVHQYPWGRRVAFHLCGLDQESIASNPTREA